MSRASRNDDRLRLERLAPHSLLVSSIRFGRVCRIGSLALLVAALAVGVPVPGHTHHDDGIHKLGASDHGHGFTLVQHEMEFERSAVVVALMATPSASSVLQVLVLTVAPPARDEDFCECRAPPGVSPRAPPV